MYIKFCLEHLKREDLKHFATIKILYGEGLLASRTTPKLEDHPLSAVRDCLFNIFAATLRSPMVGFCEYGNEPSVSIKDIF
jgi:hypothetical protein